MVHTNITEEKTTQYKQINNDYLCEISDRDGGRMKPKGIITPQAQ